MKKRTLISFIMLLALTSTVVLNFNSCKPAGKNIGLQLYSIRDSIYRDVPAAVEKVAAMGYTFIEPAGYSDGKFYGMDPSQFKDLCEKNGLRILSSHTSHNLPDSTNYDETMAWWDKCIDAHLEAGANYIVQPSMGRSAYESIENISLWCAYFNEIGAKCNAKGIRFGYHNHANEFTTVFGDTILYDFMLQNTDPEKVMFQLDLYWCVVGGKNPVD